MKKVIIGAFFLAPAFVSAQNLENILDIVTGVKNVVVNIIPIVFALILVYFFWGLAQFVLNSGDDEKRTSGRQRMLWGLVALFVASSVWGLTGFIGKAINLEKTDGISVPKINNF